jgi:restriction system protein
MSEFKIPSYDALLYPLLHALLALGGSGSIEEILAKVAEIVGVPETALAKPHESDQGDQPEFGYRLAWARRRIGCRDPSRTPTARGAPDLPARVFIQGLASVMN